MPNRIMLSIVSTSLPSISSDSYHVKCSIPDACIHNQNTAVLIESKTQSPLIQEQIQGHIKQYLGTATKERTISWENISEMFRDLLKRLKGMDRFLVKQLCDFLELIGISEFNGFSETDFSMLGYLGKIPDEDYADFKRLFLRKVTKFMDLLKDDVKPVLDVKNFGSYIGKLNIQNAGAFSGLYFYDDDPKLHINYYPNINIQYYDHSMELSLNAETKSSVKRMFSCIKKKAESFDAFVRKHPDARLIFFYKFQYFPMNHFVWEPIPGFPKEFGAFEVGNIIKEIETFEKQWHSIRRTILYRMEVGKLSHSSGRIFNEKELDFARSNNPRPNYVFRFCRQYPVEMMIAKKKNIVQFMKQEIMKLKPLVELVLS
ncbi:MAG: hypothetical protein JXB26_14310 [Candidatus Aminicenantes bacterium]|nr:hypothetical protein [Candidatus Aminicenantes bacterium]